MKIAYIATIRLPTDKAHGLQIVETCSALIGNGCGVELIIPSRSTPIKYSVQKYYGLENDNFIIKLPCFDLVKFPVIGFWLTSKIFFLKVRNYLQKNTFDGIYTRDHLIANWLQKAGFSYFFEVHTLPKNFTSNWKNALTGAKGLVVISKGIRNDLINFGISDVKISVVYDAVATNKFSLENTRISKNNLGLSQTEKIVVYVGSFYKWKGVDTLRAAAGLIPDNVQVYFIGGDIIKSEGNIHMLGKIPHTEVPVWLSAADILVLPNSAKEKISSHYTSPLKLFEYMASGRPIVASDLPSIKEILDDSTATFFIPDNPSSLAEAVSNVLKNYVNAEEKAKRAQEVVKNYTWDMRAKKIMNFIKSESAK